MRDRPADASPVGIGRSAAVDVGAIDREAGDDLFQCTLQHVPGEIGRAWVGAGDAPGFASKHVELARHLVLHNPELALAYDIGERRVASGEIGVKAGQRLLTRGVDQQTGNQVGEFVAGRRSLS